ncbi:PEP-CTERM sorting domain-containing protein [Luteolibacter marinus]|uniref:PEP-CTERM sorting domain-containing protein n=1 Tax=Luteolibacter marinus TaxID=2776705 RepID=UPI001867F893|nr:PEP-CTERM sorting domain-containing protein [Luteolibacter marinus]
MSSKNFVPISAALLLTGSASAAIIVTDDFNGANVGLNGAAADVGGTWTAGSNFSADGSGASTGGSGDDNSAFIGVAALEAGKVYTISATLTELSGNFFYVGLATAAPTNTDERWQATQGNSSVNIEWRNLGLSQDFSLHTQLGGSETRHGTTSLTTTPSLDPSTLSLVIDTSSGLASSSVSLFNNGAAVTGAEGISLDLSGFAVVPAFGFGNEAGGGAWQLNAVTYSVVPEPGALALTLLGGLLLVRRRRV